MFLKRCPFCDSEPQITQDLNNIYTLYCPICYDNGINVEIKNSSLDRIQELWNSRVSVVDRNEIGKTNYGYLITPNGDVIKCDNSHPEEILNYLGIYDSFEDYDYVDICHKINILRICEHCNCISIDIPNKPNKEQITKCMNLLTNYSKYVNFNIYTSNNNKNITINNVNDCLIELDKIK